MDADSQLRNLRDFLLVYNRMTEICFQRCTTNFNYRNLTMDEERCVDSCAGKLIRSNHRLMGTYVKLMPAMVQRRMEEMESKSTEAAKAAAPAHPLAGSGPTSPIHADEHAQSGSFPPLATEPILSDVSSFPAPATSGTATAEVPLMLSPVPQMADAIILSSGLQTANVSLVSPLVTELTPQASSPVHPSVVAGIPIDKLEQVTVDSGTTTSAVPGHQSAVETKKNRTS